MLLLLTVWIIQTTFLYVKKIRKKKNQEQIDKPGQNSDTQFEPGNYAVTPENQPMLLDTQYNQYSMMNQYQTTTPMYPYDPQLQAQPYDPQLQTQPSYPQLAENNALQDTQYVQDTQDNQGQPGLNENTTSEEESGNEKTVL